MVHTFEMHGLRMALDVESGALHVLDEPSYVALQLLESENELVDRFGVEVTQQVLSEISKLRENELLFSEKRPVGLVDDGVVKALCLHLAHDCNLRCGYCFAGTGNYGGTRGLMPQDIAKQSVDFLLGNSGKRRHCEIDFFGGEPLLNFDVLRETVAYGKKRAQELGKILKFTVTTNALALTEGIRNYLNAEEISIVLSLDGRREVHDRMRRRPGGGASYDIVLENCKEMVAGRGGDNYYLRGTYTRHNRDFTEDVLAMLAEGFDRISLEPAVLTPDKEESLREEDLPGLTAEYERLVEVLWQRELDGKRADFFHFELDLKQGPCAKKRSSGCGAGAAYLAVAPDGSLYPCHQFVGEEDFCAGHVSSGIIQDKLTRFSGLDADHKEACRSCFARFFCGGGCHASAWLMNGDLLTPYSLGCALHRKRVECGLYLQARRTLQQLGSE